MDGFDPYSVLYLSFRMAPFIIVSFFVLSALLNQDVRGIIYLGGLLISAFIAIMINAIVPSSSSPANLSADNDKTLVCDILSIGSSGRISKNIPLSCVVFAYTMGYFAYPIIKHKSAAQNIPTLILFPLLCILDGVWNVSNGCVSPNNTFMAVMYILIGAIGVSFSIGILWSYVFFSKNQPGLLYMSGVSNKETCSLARNTLRCKIRTSNAGAQGSSQGLIK